MNNLRLFFWCLFSALVMSCSDSEPAEQPDNGNDPGPVIPEYTTIPIPSSTQRSGDANKGYTYLITGDYMSSGIPYNAFLIGNGQNTENLLKRSGDNAVIPYDFNAITAPNGVKIVAPNCLQCHATKINNELVIGLGNQTIDFTIDRSNDLNRLSNGIVLLYGQNSKEWAAFQTFKRSLEAVGPKTITKSRGVNAADKTTLVLASMRDKNTLELLNQPAINISDEVIPSDVPAWWLLKKKNALFYHAIGREDYCRSMITMILSTIDNVEKAKEVDVKFQDVLAYLKSLNPPKYPFTINSGLADQGRTIFTQKCTTCHGTYGSNPGYPNLLVSLKTIGTDPALSDLYTNNSAEMTYFKDWFNTGWFGNSSNGLKVVTQGGYIAPPLDGVWATAPYFHNGSVPTIEDVLNSRNRPDYWTRSFRSDDYDPVKMGWNYVRETGKVSPDTYDTTVKGYGKMGHTFGDDLSDNDRKAVLEYLKTL